VEVIFMGSTFYDGGGFCLILIVSSFFFPSLLCFVVHIPSKPIVENLMHVKVIE
jgi:hypothetical protein